MAWDEVILSIEAAQAIEAEEGIGRQLAAALARL